MSNGERGRKLLAASREHLAEMEGALRRSSWNIAVRRAQEVVELALKAVLTYLSSTIRRCTTLPICSWLRLPPGRWA